MQNLIQAVSTEQKNRLNDFIFSINQVEDIKKDKSYVFCKGGKQAITELKKILNTINKPI